MGNLFHGHGWNYGTRESVTVTIVPESEPNGYVTTAADALSVAGAVTGHATLGYAGSALSVGNDHGLQNLVMTGGSFIPVVGEAFGAVGLMYDAGDFTGTWTTNHIMTPMLNSLPTEKIDNGNGLLIPNPAEMNECQGLGGCN